MGEFQDSSDKCLCDYYTHMAFVVFVLSAFAALAAATPVGADFFGWLVSGANHEIVRSYALVLAGAVGIAIAIWRAVTADRNHELEERKWALQRFKEGVEMLVHDQPQVTMAGIYFLTTLAETRPDEYSEPVYEILSDLE
ncbi:hypothetical protein [Salaquimonas pukyongi]|uniref:hypothetical protein n=1 Tax=Salaquimonas pukyongi TaxID=2712698 RepID=UPI00096B7A3F|nr:hypothetical protein [Salaquimonas pukyongi]